MAGVTMQRITKLGSCLAGAVAILSGGPLPATPTPAAASRPGTSALYGKLPLSFEANEGQVDRAVKFLSRGEGYALFLTATEAVLTLAGPRHETAVVRMGPAGGNRHPRMVGLNRLTMESNYFRGNDPQQWHTGVATYAGVRYEGVYAGVDLVFRGNRRQLEYDLVIAPGADPRRIRLAFRGADPITIGPRGELILHTPAGDVIQQPPAVYQEAGKEPRQIEGHYVLLAPALSGGRPESAQCEVGFAVGPYDRGRPLIIDPVLAYSTFLGAGGDDRAFAIAVDGLGNAYLTGLTSSLTFPGISGSSIQAANLGGFFDVFVTKVNPAGTAIVYSTFLGGSGAEHGNSIAVDGAGNVYVTGNTTSTTFPGVNGSSIQPAPGGGVDAFLTKINATGTAIVFSTFLGGGGDDSGNGVAVDGAGNVIVMGNTTSTTFPGVNGSSIQPANGGGVDLFVAKINPAGTAIVYSTFLGGSGDEIGRGLAVDAGGNAYLTGQTTSATFPGVSGSSLQPGSGGGFDAFVIKINPGGTAIVYSTFLGGSGTDVGHGIAVDAAGNAYVTGQTSSAAFPGVTVRSLQGNNGGGFDAFVTMIDSEGAGIVYSTFLGGIGDDAGLGIAVDDAGNAYVTGFTTSTNFPGVGAGSLQAENAGSSDAFVTAIGPGGAAFVYSTYLGGSRDDAGFGIALDGTGSAYVAGATNSASFPGVGGGAIQPANAGGLWDAFVTKLANCVGTSTNLCLANDRFAVRAAWNTGDGRTGVGQVVRLTPDTGYIWFFSSANVEAVVKVLDGCALGGHFWVFAGGLTNVKLVLTVTDTQTGAITTYTNPPKTAFQPIQDTSAFACSGSS
jgi:hypothetical protein